MSFKLKILNNGEMIKMPIVSPLKEKHTYTLSIIDNNVEIPTDIDIEYTDLNTAYQVLSDFVHSFDGIKQVDGRILDEDGDDVDYCSSILN